MTSDFWATFPGLTVAVLTFVICGFVIVFVLGSKGYCTYGCPYGAAFGIADRVAPVRIRVTDACQGCATCTAVCTSNVRVHEEVRDHGMVVDPGCMKCLDCVANCPNEALFVGAGRPAIGTSGGGREPGSLDWPEEILAAFVFTLGFFAFRGLYGQIPFLFSLGLAAILAGLVVVTWRVIRRPDAWMGPIRLKTEGRLRVSGRVYLVMMALVVAFWLHAAVIQGLTRSGNRLYAATSAARNAALDIQKTPPPLGSQQKESVSAAKRMLDRLERWSPVSSPLRDRQRAWLAYLQGDRFEAARLVESALAAHNNDAEAHLLDARVRVDEGNWLEAARAFARAVEIDPQQPLGFLGLGTVLGRNGQLDDALQVFSSGLETHPGSADLWYNAGLTRALQGDVDGAVSDLQRALRSDPDHLPARENLAGVLAGAGRFDEAVPVYDEAVRRSPDDAQLRVMAGKACLEAGLRRKAELHIEAAIELDPAMKPARAWLEDGNEDR